MIWCNDVRLLHVIFLFLWYSAQLYFSSASNCASFPHSASAILLDTLNSVNMNARLPWVPFSAITCGWAFIINQLWADVLNAVYFRRGLTCTLGLTNDLIDGGQPRAIPHLCKAKPNHVLKTVFSPRRVNHRLWSSRCLSQESKINCG